MKFIKLSSLATIPSKRDGDIGYDLVAISVTETPDYIEYDTGIAIQIEKGFTGFLYCRSSISNYDLSLCNSVGVIDPNYKGSLKFRFRRTAPSPLNPHIYGIGDKIGQLVIHPVYTGNLMEMSINELNEIESERQDKGFGSTGN